MSILLCAYFPEGIVFAADKNLTMLCEYADGTLDHDILVGSAVKVIPWPNRKAVVGYCGLAQLAGIPLSEWIRQFVAQERDFDDLDSLESRLRNSIQRDFDGDYPGDVPPNGAGLIVQLGGFRYENGVPVPANYVISNVPKYDSCGEYAPPIKKLGGPDDRVRKIMEGRRIGAAEFREWLVKFYDRGELLWFNDGRHFQAFNIFKGRLWQAIAQVRESPCSFLPPVATFDDRIAYCKMAVELYGSFFSHHFLPKDRSVGGGVDAEWVTWPESSCHS